MATRTRLLTNCQPLQSVSAADAGDAEVEVYATSKFAADARRVIGQRIDAVLIEGAPAELLRWCLLRKLVPFSSFRILSLDYLPKRPVTTKERVRLALVRWLLREVDRFVVYQKEASGFCAVLGVPASRLRYVPFKVNRIESLLGLAPGDNGAFLSCGRSFRDYATLCEAFRDLPYECRILAQWSEVEQHGTRFDGVDTPANVKLITDDGTQDSWNEILSQARAVILPIDPDTLFPAGIGTYLVAMALGKCVIMTEGPGTAGLLDETTAVLVPPKDAAALRRAVQRVAEDAAYRDSVAAGGRAYALSLGGEDRLARDVLAEVRQLIADRRGGRSAAREARDAELTAQPR